MTEAGAIAVPGWLLLLLVLISISGILKVVLDLNRWDKNRQEKKRAASRSHIQTPQRKPLQGDFH
jgi:hypothetical protein